MIFSCEQLMSRYASQSNVTVAHYVTNYSLRSMGAPAVLHGIVRNLGQTTGLCRTRARTQEKPGLEKKPNPNLKKKSGLAIEKTRVQKIRIRNQNQFKIQSSGNAGTKWKKTGLERRVLGINNVYAKFIHISVYHCMVGQLDKIKIGSLEPLLMCLFRKNLSTCQLVF